MDSDKTVNHPGLYVRKNVIPKGMTVKAAAELIGIGRPALSNFLNGKSALSSNLAFRLKKAFDVDDELLLNMQADYDKQKLSRVTEEIGVKSFVPHFLSIKSHQIEDWVDKKIDARSLLPVLLRKLVHSTGSGLTEVNFPGYDNSQRHGADGQVCSDTATPWIPKGISHWEFGTDKNINKKAESDYLAKTKATDVTQRMSTTYVFVTPRKWNGLNKWLKEKKAEGKWKSVRAFDSNDIEQWLEQSVPAQIWLAEQLDIIHHKGYETLDLFWERWANVCSPKLLPILFDPSIETHKATFQEWMNNPTTKPLLVSADSKEEALAFLNCMFNDIEFIKNKDIVAVFHSASALKTLIESTIKFIPIISTTDVERELFEGSRQVKSIILRPQNSTKNKIDIKLERLNTDDFEKSLKSMGIKQDIDRLAKESGRSISILRRRLAKSDVISSPKWAFEDKNARKLVPLALAGTWSTASEADRIIISKLAKDDYHNIETDFNSLLNIDDSPVWSLMKYRGVNSKLDSLFAIERMVTQVDIDDFFDVAKDILSEYNPALDLPEEKRWASALYGKVRSYSPELRAGICETLVLLSVNGNYLFKERFDVDVEVKVDNLIHKLLTPLTLEKLLSQTENLPFYAEAAPDTFLNIIEEDLYSDNPIIYGLLKPVDASLFGVSPSRTHLLWALECLAWNPKNLSKVSMILAQLSSVGEIKDNWGNKPIESLRAIFRSWMPQTAASNEQRIAVLKIIAKRYPEIAWNIAVEQIRPGQKIGVSSYRPNWRDDASGKGQVVTTQKLLDFQQKSFEFLKQYPTQTVKTIIDLLQIIEYIPLREQEIVWSLIEEWSFQANESEKVSVRDKLRRLTRTNQINKDKNHSMVINRAKKLYKTLEPSNIVLCHAWLFKDRWIEERVMELDSEDNSEGIEKLRLNSISQLLVHNGIDNIIELVRLSNEPFLIGEYVLKGTDDANLLMGITKKCFFRSDDFKTKYDRCIEGILSSISDENLRNKILKDFMEELSEKQQISLIVLAPFDENTWSLLDEYSSNVREGYWRNVTPSWTKHSQSSVNIAVEELLKANRPRAAFYNARMSFDDLETHLLKKLLIDVVSIHSETSNHYRIEPYYVLNALESLGSRTDVMKIELAQLEFYFIDALKDLDNGIPNLEKEVLNSPSLFTEMISYAYKRRDGQKDSEELENRTEKQKEIMGRSAYLLLDSISKLPGMKPSGEVDEELLNSWINEVREKCKEIGRSEISDQHIGMLLVNAPQTEGEAWPTKEVCELIENIRSPHIKKGFMMGISNSRGAYWYSNGREESELSTKYRKWSALIEFEYPYVSSILEEIAKSYDREIIMQASEKKIMGKLEN